MRFFTELYEAFKGNMDMNLRIMSKDGVITMQITQGVKNDAVKPIEMNGTPAEFDEGFFDNVIPGVVEVHGLVTNIEEAKASAAKALEESKKKPADKKLAEKPAKKEKPGKREKKSKLPDVKAASIFDEPKAEEDKPEPGAVEDEPEGEDSTPEE